MLKEEIVIMIRIKKHSVVSLFLIIYLFVCIFFPLDPYKLKIIILALMFCYSHKEYASFLSKMHYTSIFLIGCIYPCILFLLSFIRSRNISNSASQAYIPILLLIIVPVLYNDINFEKMISVILFVEAILVVSIIALDVLHIYDVNDSPIRKFYYDWGMGYMGKSHAYAAYYKVFFKTSPMLILLFDYAWRNKKIIICVITALAMLFSGTRANIIVLFGYIVFCSYFFGSNNQVKRLLIRIVFCVAIICLFRYLINSFESMMNSEGSVSSDKTRSGQMTGLIEALSNPVTFIFGDGFGSLFYDYGRNKYMSGVELSYINLLRQIGIILFIPFIVFVALPLFSRINKQTKVAYIGYMLIAWTNPLLFTSTAFLVYAYVYWLMYQSKIKMNNNAYFWRYISDIYNNA